MLPYKRPDSPLLSSLISRTASATKLNQLYQDSATRSATATPSAYVTSSLNPARNVPILDSSSRFQNGNPSIDSLPVISHIDEFRALLDELSEAVTLFKDDEVFTKFEKLTKLNTTIENDIKELHLHKQRRKSLKQLQNRHKSLDDLQKNTLKKLLSYRSELRKLPRAKTYELKHDKDNDPNSLKIDVKDIFAYSMKLAKFSKAPVAMGNLSHQIHPNNYIWPAEDSLRRGMLAMSYIQEKEILENVLGEEKPVSVTKEETSKENSERVSILPNKESGDTSLNGTPHPSNRDHIEIAPTAPTAPTAVDEDENGYSNEVADLDLDLFDPDAELSD